MIAIPLLCHALVVSPTTKQLVIQEIEVPRPAAHEILIRVYAAGVNRADLDQKKGNYAPPSGASPVIGLEAAGSVVSIGEEVSRFKVGDRVMALLNGGGYGQFAVASEFTTMALPNSLSYKEGAAIPESYFTVWSNVFQDGNLKPNETVLIHGGASAVGSAAIQMIKLKGAQVIATVTGASKVDFCRSLGADAVCDRTVEELESWLKKVTQGHGVDLIFDWVGADLLTTHLNHLRKKGRLVLIDSMTGDLAQIDLGTLMTKNLQVTGSLLRPRSLQEKSQIREELEAQVLPFLRSGALKPPPVYRTLPLDKANEAHEILENRQNQGKVVLTVNTD